VSTPPVRVCLVCSGNICRSPSAEVVLRRQLAGAGLSDLVVVSSSGTGDWHVGEPMDPRAAGALARRGYPTGHRAREFDPADLDELDLVVAMDRGHLRYLRRLAGEGPAASRVRLLREFDPGARDDLDVPDPYFGGPDGFERVLDLIEAGCAGLTEYLRHLLASGSAAAG
jgi:protein-tyrosine phosphatase